MGAAGIGRDDVRSRFGLPTARSEGTARYGALSYRKPCSCARLSLRQAQKRQVLECPVLYRSGAPGTRRHAATKSLVFIGEIRRPASIVDTTNMYHCQVR